jgi:hypothetical protein
MDFSSPPRRALAVRRRPSPPCWAALPLLLFSSVLASPAARVTIFTTGNGVVYYHGRLLAAPYTFSADFHMEGADTLWDRVYINGHPLTPRQPHHAMTHLDSFSVSRARALGDACARAHIPEGATSLERTPAIAAAYASVRTLVDSARVIADRQVDVYWKGSLRPAHFSIGDRPMLTPPEQSRAKIHETLNTYAPSLERGAALLFHDEVIIVPRSKLPLLDREIASVRGGASQGNLILRNPTVVAEFRSPPPLPSPEE